MCRLYSAARKREVGPGKSLVLVEKDLLIKARWFVKLNCGIGFELRGCFLAQPTAQHGNEATHSNAVYIAISW